MPRVLYISLHRYDNGFFYPSNTDGQPDKIGTGYGIGKNVNIAWNTDNGTIKVGDNEYIYAFEVFIKPISKEYNPELIIVSAGFDCAVGDPLGGLYVTPSCFNYMTSKLMNFANGKIVIALEGGYNLTAISKSMAACLNALLKEPPMKLLNENYGGPNPSFAMNTIAETIKAHQPYWIFLKKN